MLLRHSLFVVVCLIISSCGFSPLYTGQSNDKAISGQELQQETAHIFIDEIPERKGQILRRALKNSLTPLGEPENTKYRLSVSLSEASLAEQGVRQDNLATRYVMTYTATYTLFTYPENKQILASSTIGRSNYDVQISPYASDIAEQAANNRIMKILGEDIALRVATFLRTYKDTSEQKVPQ